MRIGIIGLLHESNTFLASPTVIDNFKQVTLATGAEIPPLFEESHHEIGGFFVGLKQLSDSIEEPIEIVPIFVGRSLPSGTISSECWQELQRRLFQELEQAGPLDGLLLAPHGATVSEEILDADGNWMQKVRQVVGLDLPLIATCDPHANLSPQMVAACDAILAYRTNPHLDQKQRGMQAAELLVRTIQGEIKPCMEAIFPPMAISIDRQMTEEWPLSELCATANEQQLTEPDLLSNSILLGFPYADVPEMGSAVVVVTDNDPAKARAYAQKLAEKMWSHREDLAADLVSIETALDRCREFSEPVCLLDMGDNVGGGSSADGTSLAEALHHRNEFSAFVCLYDPQVVKEAEAVGAGNRATFSVGGKTDDLHGSPFTAEFEIVSFHDGRFRESEVRHGGFSEFDQGMTVILKTSTDLTIMVTSRRMVPFSLQQVISGDLDPASFDVLVAKGVNAPIAAYREVCPHFIRVNTPGSTSADMTQLPFEHRRRPLFPFERETSWSSEDASAE
ncbi:MAG: M81 family metallopeptidase [Planctomycetaceae bacterium]|nr:M81 family metallopeptidase [Planctomycetaceae bacterium]